MNKDSIEKDLERLNEAYWLLSLVNAQLIFVQEDDANLYNRVDEIQNDVGRLIDRKMRERNENDR